MRRKIILLVALISVPMFLLPSLALAVEGRDLVHQMSKRRDKVLSVFSIRKMSTCPYQKVNKKYVCQEKPRVKVFEAFSKNYGPTALNGKRDSKNVSIILSPPGEQGIGVLSYNYKEDELEDEAWLYFSEMKTVRRITSSKKDEDEPPKGSFFGSEFGVEDDASHPIDDYAYKILKSETYRKRDCWVLESIPKPKRFRKSNYSRHLSWIDKEKLVTLKTIKYNRQGKKIKRFIYSDWEKYDDLWVSRKSLVYNFFTRRMSSAFTQRIHFNLPVEDSFLTQRTLTDSIFRERILKKMRGYLN